MREVIRTPYTVKEVKERHGVVDNPIFIICDTNEKVPKRRRIRIPDYKHEAYETAKLMVAGDCFVLVEAIITNVKYDDGRCARVIEEITPCFEVEEL